MTISLTDAGKRFNREWIFRHFNYTFLPGQTYAIVGPNGSGKSTLLQVLAGSMDVSEGKLIRELPGFVIDEENFYKQIAIAAPYVEVIEEMNAIEFLEFHFNFKPILQNVSIKEIIIKAGLEKSAKKQIRYYSSGMKQRIKLAQAVFADVPILLLDEPCTNLDETGYSLYHQLIREHTNGKTVIVSSNDNNEYDFCKNVINIMDYK